MGERSLDTHPAAHLLRTCALSQRSGERSCGPERPKCWGCGVQWSETLGACMVWRSSARGLIRWSEVLSLGLPRRAVTVNKGAGRGRKGITARRQSRRDSVLVHSAGGRAVVTIVSVLSTLSRRDARHLLPRDKHSHPGVELSYRHQIPHQRRAGFRPASRRGRSRVCPHVRHVHICHGRLRRSSSFFTCLRCSELLLAKAIESPETPPPRTARPRSPEPRQYRCPGAVHSPVPMYPCITLRVCAEQHSHAI